MNKIRYHIPTEQFAFVEVEWDLDSNNEVPSYASVKADVLGRKHGEGLGEAEFGRLLDRYMLAKGYNAMTAEEYESLDLEQQRMIQALKRAYKRQEAKENKLTEEKVKEF